ncbi:hypothetical protein CP980_05360 [Streptomyces vinaceus]|uniref:Lipoprotein n=1 Tax=Streptomyces vinaceus TaxID=1960 RepID=A0A5J6J378_STRVI|nr:hypothetical protein [Streptomyces vinaceus]QEV44572.1 hypothetical protein CP980_05360 [Streptomyces vinaceus]
MPRSPRPAASAAAAAVLLATLLCGGCAARVAAGQEPAEGSSAPAPASTARPAPLQEIAAALGCAPETTVDAEELREGACGSGQQGFRMATFTSEQGRRTWLNEAQMYGGTYLVGPTWVITAASAEALAGAHTRLGGTIETVSGHGSSPHDAPHDASHDPSHDLAHDPSHDPAHDASHDGGHDSPSPAAS